MIIHVASLKEGKPEAVAEELDPKEVDVEFSDFHYIGKISVRGTVEKSLTSVVLKASVDRDVEQVCARCLKEVKESFSDSVEYNYDVSSVDEIDTLSDIRDDLILSHPERFLCKEDCKGLCASCGGDLNAGKCKCKNNQSKNSFSKLQKFKKATNDEKE